MLVVGAPFIPSPETHLELGAETVHVSSVDATEPVEMLCFIAPPRLSGVRQLLPAISITVEDQRMKVDLASLLIDHHEARRKPRGSAGVPTKAQRSERSLCGRQVIASNRQI